MCENHFFPRVKLVQIHVERELLLQVVPLIHGRHRNSEIMCSWRECLNALLTLNLPSNGPELVESESFEMSSPQTNWRSLARDDPKLLGDSEVVPIFKWSGWRFDS